MSVERTASGIGTLPVADTNHASDAPPAVAPVARPMEDAPRGGVDMAEEEDPQEGPADKGGSTPK